MLSAQEVRSDTSMYELCPEPTGKRGLPRKKGVNINLDGILKCFSKYKFQSAISFQISKDLILSTVVQKMPKSKY